MPKKSTASGPFTRSPRLARDLAAVEACRDTYAGTLRMREQGEKYLPRYPLEQVDEESGYDPYRDRLRRAVLYNGTRSTVRAFSGMVFRKDVVRAVSKPGEHQNPNAVPEEIVWHWDNIDLTGRNGSVFAKSAFRAKVKDGYSLIFVDWSGPEGAVRAAEEGTSRPYWSLVRRDQVLRYFVEKIDGAEEVVSIAFVEEFTERDGEFGEKVMERARQYDLEGWEGGAPRDTFRVRYRSWTREKGSGDEDGDKEKDLYLGPRMRRIPLAVDYAEQEGVLESDPPLLDLAMENILHWQIRSDRDTNMHTSNVPIFWTAGLDDEEFKVMLVGAAAGVALPLEGSCGFAETTGAALDSTATELHAIERRMASMGLSNLVEKPRSAETAEARRMEKAERDSDLAAMARATEDAIENALQLHAEWMGLDSGGTCEVNRDFGVEVLQPAMVQVLAAMVGDSISLETLWDILLQGNVLPENFDPEVERERIVSGGFAPLGREAA